MSTIVHSAASGIHPAFYIQSGDPGAVGAGRIWLDTTNTPPTLKKRNAGDTGWDFITGPIFTTEFAASDFKMTGVTGSASAWRMMGANSSSHPTTGTYVAGDVSPGLDGTWWMCTTGGTPGTWTQMGGSAGSESESHAFVGSDVTLSGANTYVDAVSVTVSAGTYFLIGHIVCVNSPSGADHSGKLWDGTTVLTSDETSLTAAFTGHLDFYAWVTPVGSTTYKISYTCDDINGKVKAAIPHNAAGNTASYIRAIKFV